MTGCARILRQLRRFSRESQLDMRPKKALGPQCLQRFRCGVPLRIVPLMTPGGEGYRLA